MFICNHSGIESCTLLLYAVALLIYNYMLAVRVYSCLFFLNCSYVFFFLLSSLWTDCVTHFLVCNKVYYIIIIVELEYNA